MFRTRLTGNVCGFGFSEVFMFIIRNCLCSLVKCINVSVHFELVDMFLESFVNEASVIQFLRHVAFKYGHLSYLML